MFVSFSSAETLDFTKSTFVNSGSFAGTMYNISAIGGSLSWGQDHDGNSCLGFGLVCQEDGLGVGDDEISIGDERIRIEFDDFITISGLAFLDLFTSTDGTMHESAVVEYDGGSMSFDSLDSEIPNGNSGFRLITGLSIFTDFLEFSAGGLNDNVGVDDYALAAIMSPVPIPPALLMFGAALGGIGFLSRRRKFVRE